MAAALAGDFLELFSLVFPEKLPECHTLTPASALAAQTNMYGATDDTQPCEC